LFRHEVETVTVPLNEAMAIVGIVLGQFGQIKQ
jgi:hypothetical protein